MTARQEILATTAVLAALAALALTAGLLLLGSVTIYLFLAGALAVLAWHP